ncbi:unnamed protein product [Amaranthus hypochondriacus]
MPLTLIVFFLLMNLAPKFTLAERPEASKYKEYKVIRKMLIEKGHEVERREREDYPSYNLRSPLRHWSRQWAYSPPPLA